VLISGDQVLPRISPVVAVWPAVPHADPLDDFLTSLERFRPLPADTFVLPSHGLPFSGLHARLDDLAHHHDKRLEQTLEICAQPSTGAEVLRRLFTRELDPHQLLFATGESLAHLHYLMAHGRILRETRDDGVWVYRAA
jgi:glyoxylase-like metal-dependent hydrolase (beta-lactamase superfamily II)